MTQVEDQRRAGDPTRTRPSGRERREREGGGTPVRGSWSWVHPDHSCDTGRSLPGGQHATRRALLVTGNAQLRQSSTADIYDDYVRSIALAGQELRVGDYRFLVITVTIYFES